MRYNLICYHAEINWNDYIILSTHILPEVSMICDRIIIINQGKIVILGVFLTAQSVEMLRYRH